MEYPHERAALQVETGVFSVKSKLCHRFALQTLRLRVEQRRTPNLAQDGKDDRATGVRDTTSANMRWNNFRIACYTTDIIEIAR